MVEEVDLGSPSLIVPAVSVCGRKATLKKMGKAVRGQELCESRGGRPGLPVPNSPYGVCGRKATVKKNGKAVRSEVRCESRGGRPGLPVPNSPHGLWVT